MDYESNPCFQCNKHVKGHQNNMQGVELINTNYMIWPLNMNHVSVKHVYSTKMITYPCCGASNNMRRMHIFSIETFFLCFTIISFL